ncbi:hypothetical protein [Celeribacter marinus]|uniref:hypothetical protein n=1 Tax=Celeribacter marinus TaxID=1397108 RepID=UPI0031738EC4
MNINLTISSQTNRSKTPVPDGICVVASAKRHEWRHTVVISHPRLAELLTHHQVDQLSQIAALDHVRAHEAGAMGPPTATPRKPASMHQFGFQSEAHSHVLIQAAIAMIRETAAKLEWTVTVTDGDKGNA